MRNAIVLCLLAVFYTADATTLNILLRQIQSTILTVENTIQQLERLHDNVEKDVNLTVMKKLLEQIEAYDKYVIPILDTIRKDVEDAKARNKDAQPCYDSALNTLKNIGNSADTCARQCQESAKTSIKKNLCFIDDLITIGRKLIEELNSIIPECFKRNSRLIDIIKLHTCITNQLGISRVSVRKLKIDSSSARSTAISATNPVLQQTTNCLSNVYSIARSRVPEARSDATRCLEFAQKEPIIY